MPYYAKPATGHPMFAVAGSYLEALWLRQGYVEVSGQVPPPEEQPEPFDRPVRRINGESPGVDGSITLTPEDIGALATGYTPPVTSVNGMVGAVEIDPPPVLDLATTTPAAVGITGAVGAEVTAARADHVHAERVALAGARRTLTEVTATSGTTEKVVLDSGPVALLANSVYHVDMSLVWQSSATNDDFDFRIRETNLTGTLLSEGVYPRTTGAYPHVTPRTYAYVTTTAKTVTFVVTAQRVAGTGTCRVLLNSHLLISYAGPSSALTIV